MRFLINSRDGSAVLSSIIRTAMKKAERQQFGDETGTHETFVCSVKRKKCWHGTKLRRNVRLQLFCTEQKWLRFVQNNKRYLLACEIHFSPLSFLKEKSRLMWSSRSRYVPLPSLNQPTGFHKIGYEQYAIGGHHNLVLFKSLKSVVRTWQTHGIVRWGRY